MRDLVTAARYLTIVPLPGRAVASGDAIGRSAPWFPLVGCAIGLALVVIERLTSRVFEPMLVALLTVTAWKLLTGGLHLDGLADSLDGLMGRDRTHRLAIMRDSRIGVYGALGLILALLLTIAALAELPESVRWRALVVAPAIGRAAAPLLAVMFRPAADTGYAVAFARGLRPGGALIAAVIALVVSLGLLRTAGLVAFVASTMATGALGLFMSRRLGGITGDVLGAAVEVSELVTLLALGAGRLTPA